MTKLVKPANRALFVACVVLTGALAGAFVWAFFFLMDAGLGFFVERWPPRAFQLAQ